MHLNTLIERADQAQDRAEIWQLATEFYASCGFDKLIYVDQKAGQTHVETTFPESWVSHYMAEGYAAHDPFFRYCCASFETIGTGIDYLRDYDYLTREERKLIQEASEAGFQAGFSVTLRPASPKGLAGWNIGSSLSRQEVEKLRSEHQPVLQLVASFLDQKLQLLGAEAEELFLSSRELECLGLVARGMRTKSIASELGLQPVTVELYLKNARAKLGAATREHAVFLAVKNGLL